MSAQSAPICQWCRMPVKGAPTWWNDKPQCRDPFACDKRIPVTPARGPL